MKHNISDILTVAADMESCIPTGDKLSDIVVDCADQELFEDDLFYVSAAGSTTSYEQFRSRFHLD